MNVGRRVAAGTWVEIHAVLLPAGERAPEVPPETARVPLEMRVKGTLLRDAVVGDEVEILTAAGRRLEGTLSVAQPAYSHSFGAPVPELTRIGGQLRQALRERGVAS